MDKASKDLTKRITKIAIWTGVVLGILSLILLITLMNKRVSFFSINGNSMEPTLSHGDSVVVKQSDGVYKGELLFFRQPDQWKDYKKSDHTLIKRIIATPGDELVYDGEELYVNGESVYNLKENNYQCEIDEYSHKLGKKQVFVMGDNQKESLDSLRILCDGNADKSFVPRLSVKDYGKIIKIF